MANEKMESTSLLCNRSSVSSSSSPSSYSSSNRDDIPIDAESNVVAIDDAASCRRGNRNESSSTVSVWKRMTIMTTLSYMCMGMFIVVVAYYNLSIGGNVVVTNAEDKYLGELVLKRNEKENIIGGTASSDACFGLSKEKGGVEPETYFPQLNKAFEYLTKGLKNDKQFSDLVQPFGQCSPPSIPVPDFEYGNSDANVYDDAATDAAADDDADSNDTIKHDDKDDSSSFFGGVNIQFHCVDLSTTTAGDGRSLKNLFEPARKLLKGTGWRSLAARAALTASLLPVERLIGADFLSAEPLSGPFHQDMTALTKLVDDTVDRCVPLLTKPWTPLFDAMYHNKCTTEIASRLPPNSIWSVNEKILVFASAIAYQTFAYTSTNQKEVSDCFYDAFAVHQGMGFGSVLGVNPDVAATALKEFYNEKNEQQTEKGAAEAWAVGLDLLQHGLQVFLYYINDDPMADAVLEFTKWHWISLIFVRQMATDKGFPQYMTDFTVFSFQKSFVPLMK